MSEQLTPEREAEIRVKLEREAKAHGSVHFVPPKAGMVRDLLGEIDRLRAANAELAPLAVNAANALRDEKRHHEIAAQEVAKLRARVAELEKDSAALAALYAAGVDNWDGYSDAMQAVAS